MHKAMIMTVEEVQSLGQIKRDEDGTFPALVKYGAKGVWTDETGKQHFVVNTNYSGGRNAAFCYEVYPIVIE